jgi:DNA repair protein SbcC/Rad50
MILNYVELENIRSYKHAKIEFPKGITLFEGDIGSGKSTVLMAIEFALFGLGSQKPDSLLSKKATEGNVILNFEVEKKTYEIKRKLKRRGDLISQDSKSCHLVSDGEMEPLSASELKQRILQILRFNEPASANSESRIYRYAVFTPQEEMKKVLSESKMRLETIRKAFGMEDYKTAAENAKIIISTLKTEIAIYKERFSNVAEQKKSLEKSTGEEMKESHEISELMKQLTTQEKHESLAHKSVVEARKKQKEKDKIEFEKDNIGKTLTKSKSNHKSILEEIEEKEQEIEDANDRIIKLEKISKPTSKNILQIDEEIIDIEKLNTRLTNVKSKIDTTVDDLSKLSKKLGSYNDSKTEKLQTQLVELNNLLTRLNNQHKEVEDEIIEKEKEKAGLEERKRNLESKIKDVSNLGSKCPICENTLTAEHIKNLEIERREKLQETIDSIKKIQNEIGEKSNKKGNLRKQILDKESVRSKIESVLPILQQQEEKNEQLRQSQLELRGLDAKKVIPEEKSFPNNGKFNNSLAYMKALRDALLEFVNAKNRIEYEKNTKVKTEDQLKKIKEKNELLVQEISVLEGKLNDVSKSLSDIGNIDDVLRKSEKDEENIRDKIEALKEDLSARKERTKNLKDEIERIRKEISNSEKAQEKYEKFSNCNDWLKEFFIPTLEQVEKQVLRSIQHSFNSIYQNWFSVLIDDPTKQSRIDEDFTPLVEQDGYEQNIEYLSGGEKTSIALSYRLTLNSMIRQETESLKSNLLILDEPTDGFSKTQLSKVRTVLQQLQSQQIILVSHEKELETYVDNIFYISKDGGNSHVFRKNA